MKQETPKKKKVNVKLKTPEKESQIRCESTLSEISVKSFNFNSFIDEIEECPDKV